MQDLCDIAFVEDTLLPHDQVKNDRGVLQDPAGIFRASCVVQLDPFELRPHTLLLRLALYRLGANTQMDGRLEIDTLLLIGPAIDLEVDAAQRQMMVLPLEPAVAQDVEVLGRSSPEFIEDLARFRTDRLAVIAHDRDLFRPEAVLGEWPQRGHQMDMRIAGIIVEHPVGDHAFRKNVFLDEIPHQGDVLVGGQLQR